MNIIYQKKMTFKELVEAAMDGKIEPGQYKSLFKSNSAVRVLLSRDRLSLAFDRASQFNDTDIFMGIINKIELNTHTTLRFPLLVVVKSNKDHGKYFYKEYAPDVSILDILKMESNTLFHEDSEEFEDDDESNVLYVYRKDASGLIKELIWHRDYGIPRNNGDVIIEI